MMVCYTSVAADKRIAMPVQGCKMTVQWAVLYNNIKELYKMTNCEKI